MKPLKSILIAFLCLCLVGCSFATESPGETTEPAAAAIPVSTAPETQPPTEPPTEPVPETTVPPEPVEYVLSFVGDCCLANQKGWGPDQYFMGTVKDNYAYPFSGVKSYFEADEFTFINLENPLTDGGKQANKSFVFKGPTAYTAILTEGSVEFANVANNHAMDYGKSGYADTLTALDGAGIQYAESGSYRIFTTPNGLTIGVYAELYPTNADRMPEIFSILRQEGAEIIIACLHWGREYYYKPNASQIEVGHAAIDAGADIVYGHHSHILQPIEEYNGGIIYYSLGNFCFGGNTNPKDKDTAILQQSIIREPDGTVHLGELTIIPCSLSSKDWTNDFCPVPLDPESEAYARVLQKLDGTYPKNKLVVSYRPELS